MNILILTFYYPPDLCAGSFRINGLMRVLKKRYGKTVNVHVITTMPNRYVTFNEDAKPFEQDVNLSIYRIQLPEHKSGMIDQAKAFVRFYKKGFKRAKACEFDVVFATSSRLFTAFLGARVAEKKKVPLVLDIRDIFVDTMENILSAKVKLFTIPILKRIEKFTFKRASHINMVSEGFADYIKQCAPRVSTSFIPNGIDEEFENAPLDMPKQKDVKIITYAGNIGEGQGMHKIIPQLASYLGDDYVFQIIGAGGLIETLEQEISNAGVNNTRLIKPVSRAVLLKYYKESDYLFLHLNDYKAFLKVLPSKVFEYGALGKKVIAGVGGYAADFVRKNLPEALVFKPCDLNDFQLKWESGYPKEPTNIEAFRSKFARRVGMEKLAEIIVNTQG